MKKGAISIEMIIVIILALLVLVIVAAAFSGGMNELWRKITGYYKIYSVSDTNAAKQQCDSLCTTSTTAADKSASAFCTTPIPLRKETGEEIQVKCYESPIEASCEGKSGKAFCGK